MKQMRLESRLWWKKPPLSQEHNKIGPIEIEKRTPGMEEQGKRGGEIDG